MLTQYYGWDVGGAHLKFAALAADGTVNDVRQIACPLWQGPEMLQNALALRSRSLVELMLGFASLTPTYHLLPSTKPAPNPGSRNRHRIRTRTRTKQTR